MIMQDSYLPLECTPETIAECTFCTNTSIPEYDVTYRTGLHRHCRDCAIEFGITETNPQPVDN